MLICFWQFFSIKRPSNFFACKITNNICPPLSVFNVFNHKNFVRPIRSIIFLNFDILTISPVLNFGSSSLISLRKLIYVFDFKSASFILFVVWCVLLYLLIRYSNTYNLSIYTFFILQAYTYKFHSLSSNRLFSNNRFSSLWVEHISTRFFIWPWFLWSVLKYTAFIYPYFIWFAIRFIQNLLKSISSCNTFFIFQGNSPCIFIENIKNT